MYNHLDQARHGKDWLLATKAKAFCSRNLSSAIYKELDKKRGCVNSQPDESPLFAKPKFGGT